MTNRITSCDDRQDDLPRPIGEILEELLAEYEIRFPGINVTVVESAATAA